MVRHIKPILVLGMTLVLGLSACKSVGTGPTTAAPTPTIGNTAQPYPLATPYAQGPTAGICASPEGDMVVVTINPDVPDPRCTKVRPDQKLTVLNKTQDMLEVSIGRFTASLEPGAETIIDTPFGEYLAPGVHLLQVTPYFSAELWLEGK
jgi:hypothetical protein